MTSLCRLLELDHSVEPFIQNSSFCPACHQLIRDVDFFVRTIEKCRKSLSKLKNTAEKLLIQNAAELEYGSNEYTKTVKSIVQSLRLRNQGFKAVPVPTPSSSSPKLLASLPIPTAPQPGDQDANNQSIDQSVSVGSIDRPGRHIVPR